MMDKIHVLVVSGGEFEDKWEYPLAASADPSKLEPAKQADMAKRRRRCLLKKVLAEFQDGYLIKHPHPESPKLTPVPRWKSGLRMDEITPEMRAERDSINARNAALQEAFKPIDDEWQRQYVAAGEQFLRDKHAATEEEVEWACHGYHYPTPVDEIEYRIDEIPWVE